MKSGKYGLQGVYQQHLTLLKSSFALDMYADVGKHSFTHAFMGWTLIERLSARVL